MASARKTLIALCMTLLVVTMAAAQTPKVTETAGAAKVTTEQMSGTVVAVEGNNLIVRMASGELRTFNNIPDSRKAIIDGQEVGVRDLKPGTKLTATITKTETPITVRTVTVGTGRVWHVAGTTVILTLPNGENKQYKVKPDYKFVVNGQPAAVQSLKAGMTVSAEKIVEEPKVEIATDSKVTGSAPAPAPAPKPAPAPPAPKPEPAAAPPPPAPAPAPAPAKLPKTGSPVPFAGMLGLLFVGGASVIRMLRK